VTWVQEFEPMRFTSHRLLASSGISGWVTDWGPLLTLVSAVLLTLVTAWLAWVTMRMAEAAKDAAEHSRTAAEASRASAAAMQASTSVRFEISPVPGSSVGEVRRQLEEDVAGGFLRDDQEVDLRWLEPVMAIKSLLVENDGATVYVHGCQMIEVCRQPERKGLVRCESVQFSLATDAALPLRLHDGESLTFTTPHFRPGERVVRIRALLYYSFDGQTGPHERLTVWDGNRSKPERLGRVERHGRSGEGAGA
jgi:hypothetical protein